MIKEILNSTISKGLTLFPYQKVVVEWLIYTIKRYAGCILADGMGLGKTAPVLVAVDELIKQNIITASKKAIIIVPKSLLNNWEAEAERFAPELKGNIQRYEKNKDLSAAKVILVTYNRAVHNAQQLLALKPFVIIADEAHYLKNPNSTRTLIITTTFKEQKKILITGTPIENCLQDFLHLIDFTQNDPNMIYIKQQGYKLTEEDKEKLKHYIKPLTLRRLLKDYVKLPPIIIKDITCNLTPLQEKTYKQHVALKLDYKHILSHWREGLSRLLKVRFICNHPKLIKDQNHKNSHSKQSGKMIEVFKIIRRAKKKDKFIIFSQTPKTLKLMKILLKKELGLEALTLFGSHSIKERDQAVKQFQNSPKTKIILISLRAGGVGLNLTAANKLIHYDLWWNASVEDQATARAYRYGQKRTVTIYRMMTRDTFEESINTLIKNKRGLCEDVMSTIPSTPDF